MLEKVKKKELKEAKKQATKQIQNQNSEEDEDYDTSSEDESYGDEIAGEIMENGKRSRGNSHDSKNSEEKMVDEEEKKEDTENGLNEFGFGFTEDDVKPNEESSDDEEYDHQVSTYNDFDLYL